ncbi:MAG: hypothetical protein AB8B87_27670, partial [Granulosicoccus sp.]
MMMISAAQSQGITLPQNGAEPIVLHVIDSDLAKLHPAELLKVFVGPAEPCCEDRIPITGNYTRTDETLTFLPAFDFEAGQDYVAHARTARGEELVPFRIPSTASAAPALVTEIYPSGDRLPANVLRFYIHFSVPMTPHLAFDYIKLRDKAGTVDEAAFMRFKQELWNEDRTRLTVLIDPGRIKREVATNVKHGPALLVGQRYTLSVDAGWQSADGMSRLPAFTKQFIVTDPLRERPDVAQWEVTLPCLDTTEPLRIAFDRSFDRHLLGKTIKVISGDSNVMEGTVQVSNGEGHWAFFPDEPWHAGGAQVLVSAELEDVAANNFRDLLDHGGSDEAKDVSI